MSNYQHQIFKFKSQQIAVNQSFKNFDFVKGFFAVIKTSETPYFTGVSSMKVINNVSIIYIMYSSMLIGLSGGFNENILAKKELKKSITNIEPIFRIPNEAGKN
jgi:hypothetical protein